MKKTHIIAAALCTLNSMSLHAKTETPTTTVATESVSSILEGINMFTPCEHIDPAYKLTPSKNYGTEWAVDMAYGFWSTNNGDPAANDVANLYLLHAQLNQRIFQDDKNGGTWLRLELSGSVALDSRSKDSDPDFVSAMGTGTDIHGDYFGTNDFVLPEIAIMQYFDNKKYSLIFGVVNLTNYFDGVGLANDSFCSFANTGFMNSTVLPLVDSNLGAIFQAELAPNQHGMIAISRTCTSSGYNPFGSGRGYAVVGEYAYYTADEKTVLRLNPFIDSVAGSDAKGSDCSRINYGLAGSIEYAACDKVDLFLRSGFGAKQELGASFDVSVGTNIRPFSSREDDFLGIAYGVFKAANSESDATENSRQGVLEVIYSFQINDYVKIVPHCQYIHNPSYAATSDQTVIGVQTVFSF